MGIIAEIRDTFRWMRYDWVARKHNKVGHGDDYYFTVYVVGQPDEEGNSLVIGVAKCRGCNQPFAVNETMSRARRAKFNLESKYDIVN